LTDTDTVISLESLTSIFALTITLAALHSHCKVALTTVAGASPDLDLAFQRLKPSVVIATPETLSEAHARKTAEAQGLFAKLKRHRHASMLAAGAMNNTKSLTGGPRLIYTSARVGDDSVPLSPDELQNLRILTGARIIHALTAPQVAGSLAQTNPLDYRVDTSARYAHFGAPLSSVEIKLVEGKGIRILDDEDADHVGEIVVRGPSVVGGQVNLGVLGKFGADSTLRLAQGHSVL
jgi:acyl-CoA synthetase (AMP-forming)/AMP-acid ligase II